MGFHHVSNASFLFTVDSHFTRLMPSLSGMAYEFSPVHQINEAWQEIIGFWEVLADSKEENSINRSKFAESSNYRAAHLMAQQFDTLIPRLPKVQRRDFCMKEDSRCRGG